MFIIFLNSIRICPTSHTISRVRFRVQKVDLSDCGFENNPYSMTFTSNGANQAIFGGTTAPSPVELGSVKTDAFEIISSY
jgi:hypothetical protein